MTVSIYRKLPSVQCHRQRRAYVRDVNDKVTTMR